MKVGSFTAMDFYCYKFEVEVSFTPNLDQAFYGQMITTDPYAIGTKPDVEFKNDSPANDYIGMKWPVGVKKEDYPVIEVQGNTVRWIDAPGGTDTGVPKAPTIADKSMIVIVYAGACKTITSLKIFRLDYPKGKNPTSTAIEPDKLTDEVKSFKFKSA